MIELPSKFNFKDVDEKWSREWVEKNLFHAKPNSSKTPYTIVIPPPNITGILHMGHALNNTLQDIIIRYKRMNGFETLWMAGTDHAGIATQNVVEKELAKEKKTRHDVGREAFIERLWAWKQQYGDTIIHQLKKLGASCDWPRLRFTMDDGYSEAVKTVFIQLYEKGLIYRGQRIINWCPRCQTALSDEEAEHEEIQGNLYHLKYPFKDNPSQHVIVATTRPETMLGDTAVAVNPNDERYKGLIGKALILPIINREIQIITDEFVDPAFGSGAVKVTPAHDPNDFEMGRRHNLEFVNVMHPNAHINELGGPMAGMDRFKARAAVIERFKEMDLLVKIESHTHAVGHCYRCHTVVEPYLSKQWFVKMEPLARPALRAVQEGHIKFYPDRWTKVYVNWMEGIRDWCISRQIWWGHRIPVWYCANTNSKNPSCQNPIVSPTLLTKCPHCGSSDIKQDEDVLDTWFSSWLWPFATLGWPKENPDLKYFYPGSALFTASEIIFFWVARMIMAGIEFQGDIPFSDVYIHGTVRDAKGRKMSKSLGNAIDPLEIINEYGADALRFSLIINSGQDLFISKEKFEIGRNFANKMWNAARLIFMHVDPAIAKLELADTVKHKDLDLASSWIISKFNSTLERVNQAIEGFRFSEAENLIHEFFWSYFCDWYVEIIKNQWDKPIIQNTALRILENSLKMIHPFMPFVTEEIWNHIHANKYLSLEAWPKVEKLSIQPTIEIDMQKIMKVISSIRDIRSTWNIKNTQPINCYLIAPKNKDFMLLNNSRNLIESLAQLDQCQIGRKKPKIKNYAGVIFDDIICIIPMKDVIDLEKEKNRIVHQIKEQEKIATDISKRLNNPNFLSKAPQNVIDSDKSKLTSIQTRIQELKKVIANFE